MLYSAYTTPPVATVACLDTSGSKAQRDAIAEILTPADILLDLDVPTKERALEEIARFVGARTRARRARACTQVSSNGRRSDPRASAAALPYRMRV